VSRNDAPSGNRWPDPHPWKSGRYAAFSRAQSVEETLLVYAKTSKFAGWSIVPMSNKDENLTCLDMALLELTGRAA